MLKKTMTVFLVILLMVSVTALPIDTKAKTIREFEKEVEEYTRQLEEKKSKVVKNDQEVAQIQTKINKIESQITQNEADIKRLQTEIEESNEKIKQKSAESKRIMEYYQISNGDNAYLEYAFGATSITDMIYRLSVIEQLTEYNDNLMKELEKLIEDNKVKQKDLAAKKEELKALEKSLISEKERINADTSSIKESMPGVEEQIKAAKENVNYYKKLGCGTNEDIQACQYRIEQSNSGGSMPSVNGYYRPITFGYITQGFSGRKGGHLGMDLSSSDKSIAVYPIAAGQIFKIYNDNCIDSGRYRNCPYHCNGNANIVKIRHDTGNGYIYSTYIHLRSYGNIHEGMYVTPFTEIGRMGTTGCSTGPHLHLEVAPCDWHKGGGCTWSTYQDKVQYPGNYVNIPSRWNNR